MADNQSGAGASEGAAGGQNITTNVQLLHHFENKGVEAMYAVEPLRYCDHLQQVGLLPEKGLDVNDPCTDCSNTEENWVCLICYKVYCSRYKNEHMVKHGETTGHPMVLSYADLSVWCYKCDNYLDNELLKPAIKSAHQSKFGRDL